MLVNKLCASYETINLIQQGTRRLNVDVDDISVGGNTKYVRSEEGGVTPKAYTLYKHSYFPYTKRGKGVILITKELGRIIFLVVYFFPRIAWIP